MVTETIPYQQKLQQAITASQSTLCVGLDPNPARIPQTVIDESGSMAEAFVRFCHGIIEATMDYCAAYKPNIAFFEALGPEGIAAFNVVLDTIPDSKIVIADAKRGDIGTTAAQYDRAFFDFYNVDALTVNPLMGMDTLSVYADHPEKALYVLTLTSNPGAKDFLLQPMANGHALSTHIAHTLREAQTNSNTHLGMVVGATNAEQASPVLEGHPESALLIPGIGAQGGSVQTLAEQLASHRGLPLISSSRSIIYAGEHDEDWKSASAAAAKKTQSKLVSITQRYV
jgi:orotidine-5'-phosphate decarboxylase